MASLTKKEQNKLYYEKNKDKVKEKNKKYGAEKVKCPLCHYEVRRDCMARHNKSKHPQAQSE